MNLPLQFLPTLKSWVSLEGFYEISEYCLLAIFPMLLRDVASYLYYIEGADSPEEFKEVWCNIYWKKGWTPDDIVYVHLFNME